MPQVSTIDISVMEEPQSSWLAFQRGELDILNLPNTFAPVALPNGKLAPDLAKRACTCRGCCCPRSTTRRSTCAIRSSAVRSNEKLALRRAIAMAYDIDAEVRIIRKARRSRCRR